jgi:DnaK suppressor protein
VDDQVITRILDAETARLAAARAALVRERAELEAEVAMDPTADPTLLEREIDESMLTQIDGELAALAEARHRLAQGRFGTCAVCAEPISDERLLAVPTATRCVRHQSEAEVLLERRAVEGAPSAPAAESVVAAEAARHLDLVSDDEVASEAEADRQAGAEDLAVHVRRA